MFALGGLVAAFLSVRTTEWIWSYFDKPRAVYADAIGIIIGAIIAIVAWRNQNLFSKAKDITQELKKVTWPTRKETQAATLVVIITVIIASSFLGLFDMIWSWATGLLYA